MAQQVTWYMNGRIVYAQIGDAYLSAQTLAEIDDQIIPFIRHSESGGVHVILDASAVTTVQSGIDVLLSYTREPELGWNVLIANDGSLKSLLALARFRTFPSLEEGLFFLEDEDESLLMSI